MGFGAAIRWSFRTYSRLSGRASRAEYRWFALLLMLAGVTATGAILGPSLGNAGGIVVGVVISGGVLLQHHRLVRRSDPGANRFGPHPYEGVI